MLVFLVTMQQLTQLRQQVAIVLSALMILLSVAASAHTVEHITHNYTEHCILAFHQHQFGSGLSSDSPTLPVTIQNVITVEWAGNTIESIFSQYYQSRAPPLFYSSDLYSQHFTH